MSQQFINFTALPFLGAIPQSMPVGLCGPNRGNVIPIVIRWDDYPTGCVELNLQAGANVKPGLDAIRSCVIDNTFCTVSCIVQFPDTNFTVVAAADVVSSGFVLTNQQNIRIFNNFSGTFPASQQTTIFLTDFLLDTYTQANIQNVLSLWAGTSTVVDSTIYSPPALGQSTSEGFLDLSLSGFANGFPMFGTPRLGGLIVITSVKVWVLGSYTDNNTPFDMSLQIGSLFFPLNGISWTWRVENNMGNYGYLSLDERSGLNIVLNASVATNFYNAGANTLPGANAYCNVSYDWISGTYFY